VRGPGAAAPPGAHGLVRDLAVTQTGKMLLVTLAGDTPLRIAATPIAGRAVRVSVERAPNAGPQADLNTAPIARHDDSARPGEAFEVVPLRFADVSEIVGLLTTAPGIRPNDFFTPQEPAFGSAGMNNAYSGAQGPSLFNGANTTGAPSELPLGQSVDDRIGVDRRLNAVVLHGPPDQVARLKAEIAALDQPVDSVILETVFVELTESGARNVGIDLNNTNAQIGVVSYQKGSYAPLGFADQKAIVSYGLQAAIYAEVQKGQGRIISKPRIAAQSGSTAKIVTGDALPILTAITLSGVNGVSQQVQYVNVGVTLQIAPRVTDTGFVTSHLFCEVSSVTGVSQGYPTISQREASTSATVRDGEAFVIGGLTQENALRTDSGVPGLSRAPIVGALFGASRGSRSKTDLYIVVTPHIIHRRNGETSPSPPPPDPPPGE
jgi:general secretion pathway protein D